MPSLMQTKVELQPSSLYLELYDGDYSTNSTVVLQIPLDDSMDSELRPDHGYTLWSNQQEQLHHLPPLPPADPSSASFNLEAQVRDLHQHQSRSRGDCPLQGRTQLLLQFLRLLGPHRTRHQPVRLPGLPECCLHPTLPGLGGLLQAQAVGIQPVLVDDRGRWWPLLLVGQPGALRSQLPAGWTPDSWVVAVCSLANIALSLFFLRNYEDVGVGMSSNTGHGHSTCWPTWVVYFLLAAFYWQSKVFWIY